MSNPITPDEAARGKVGNIPSAVFDAFNEAIAAHYDGKRAVVLQCDVVQRIVDKGFPRHEIFGHHWLDIEDAYRAAGWDVAFDKPGYNETYEAAFTFSAKKGEQS
jgi:hypothetical protein